MARYSQGQWRCRIQYGVNTFGYIGCEYLILCQFLVEMRCQPYLAQWAFPSKYYLRVKHGDCVSAIGVCSDVTAGPLCEKNGSNPPRPEDYAIMHLK